MKNSLNSFSYHVLGISLLNDPLFDRLSSKNPQGPSSAISDANVQQLVALQRRSAELLLKAMHLSAAIHNRNEANKLRAEYSVNS